MGGGVRRRTITMNITAQRYNDKNNNSRNRKVEAAGPWNETKWDGLCASHPWAVRTTRTVDVTGRGGCNVSSHLMTPEGQATRSAPSTLPSRHYVWEGARCVFCSSIWPRNRLLQLKPRFWSIERRSGCSLRERISLIMGAYIEAFAWDTARTGLCRRTENKSLQNSKYCWTWQSVHWLASVWITVCDPAIPSVTAIHVVLCFRMTS